MWGCDTELKGWLRRGALGVVALCSLLLVLMVTKLGYDAAFPPLPPPQRKYVPPEGVMVVAGGGPLGCDFSGIPGAVPTGLMPLEGKSSVRLQIPNAYLFSPEIVEVGALGSRGAVLMYVRLDTFQPDRRPFGSRRPVGQPDEATILLWSIRPLAESLALLEKSYPYIPPFQTKEAEDLTVSRRDRDETSLYSKNERGIQDVFVCINSRKGNNPYCNHNFFHKKAGVSLTYSRSELRKWKEIRIKTKKFVDCIVSSG
jgi:hypothetical protein